LNKGEHPKRRDSVERLLGVVLEAQNIDDPFFYKPNVVLEQAIEIIEQK